MKKKGFTLMEILLSITGFFLLMVVVITIYLGILSFRYSFQARANLLETTYYMFEKIQLLLKNYTIDYEEYFNRSAIGCDSSESSFVWNIGDNGYCDLFTAYGNQNTFYYCSSLTGYVYNQEQVVYQNPLITGCVLSGFQSFGEYKHHFSDVMENADSLPSVVGDSDDIDLGFGPDAIYDHTGVQELYLLSQDNYYRIYLRRALIESGDWNNDGVISGDTEFLYTLQLLKLRSFDAGNNHDFSLTTSSGVYDGRIDTWTCDYAEGFICHGPCLSNVYSGYCLPVDADDGWVDVFDRSVTVSRWNVSVYPTKNPLFSWADTAYQISPYFILSLQTKLYAGVWQQKIRGSLDDYQFTLQSLFSTKIY